MNKLRSKPWLIAVAWQWQSWTNWLKDKKWIQSNFPKQLEWWTQMAQNSGGMITDMVWLRIWIMEFLVLDLGKQDMFLRHNWLQFHNPEINWKDGKLEFTQCPKECFLETMVFKPQDEIDLINPDEDKILAVYIGYQELLPRLTVEEIRAKSNFMTDIAEATQKTRMWEEIVPLAYWGFNKVFEKKTFNTLPLWWPWNHAIE